MGASWVLTTERVLSWEKTALPIGDDALSETDLRHLVKEDSALVWNNKGLCRVLSAPVLRSMGEVYEHQCELFNLGRHELMDLQALCFTWDQTISLEEYFQDIGKPADPDT